MKLRTVLSFGLAAALAGGFFAVTSPDAEAQTVRWRMQSTFGSQLPHLGTSGVRFVENVEKMTERQLRIRFFEPGALVPPLECFDAVSRGSVDACWTTPGYHTGKYPALAFFTTVPFGPGIGEFLAWKWFGGGNDIRDEIYAQHNLIAFDSFAIGPEASGWFRDEITSLEQLRGLKIRFFGLGAQVMQKLGASTQLLAAADIYPALERGVIDATEFSMPSMDIALGFHELVQNYYFPGWHQQVSVSELLMNREAWNNLSEAHQAVIKAALNDSVIHTYAESEYVNPTVMVEMEEKHGVVIRRWDDKALAVFEEKWMEVLEEQSAADPLFKRVADSYFEFRERYRIWGEAQSLKPTYLGN